LVRATLGDRETVVLEWARRAQGFIVREGNPHRIRRIADLSRKPLRVAKRQPEAGSHRLFLHLLARAGIRPESLDWLPRAAHAETELASIIHDGQADVGIGIEAAARSSGLVFIPLVTERLDLVTFRRDAFEPPLQTLLAWPRTPEFARQATALGGYDVANTGQVVFNA
jgi:molybdate-binding protein